MQGQTQAAIATIIWLGFLKASAVAEGTPGGRSEGWRRNTRAFRPFFGLFQALVSDFFGQDNHGNAFRHAPSRRRVPHRSIMMTPEPLPDIRQLLAFYLEA